MMKTIKLMEITSIFIIFVLICPLSVRSDDQFLNKKMLGKITMTAILSVTALVVKKLVNKDIRETEKIHKKLGIPDKAIEFQEGFDYWRMEWHGNYVYAFRNGVFAYRKGSTF
jgi:hypothetical protein